MSSSVDVKTLFEAGAHFGHKTSRWHPKMAQYIHSSRGGVHIIDLTKTAELLELAASFLADTAASGKQILLVGTKRQAQEVVGQMAESTGMPYVSVRWFGGMLTNFKTMQQRIKRLKDLSTKLESGELASRYNKLEVQRFSEEIERLEHNFGGIKDMEGQPGAVIVLDAAGDQLAVKEANKLGVPVVAIVDTNADPSNVDYPIPANDDAIKTLKLIADRLVASILEGKNKQKPTANPEEARPQVKPPKVEEKKQTAKTQKETK